MKNWTLYMRKFQWSCTGEGSLSVSYMGCSISLNVRRKEEVLENCVRECWKNWTIPAFEEIDCPCILSNSDSLCLGGMKRSRVEAGIFNSFSAPSCTTHLCAWQCIGSHWNALEKEEKSCLDVTWIWSTLSSCRISATQSCCCRPSS